MGKQYSEISEKHIDFINDQKIFFVGTAAEDGRVNVSPKGMDTLRVIDQNNVAWLNLTGSGNETAAHLLKKDRMTLMFCSFDKTPLILRLYGNAGIYHTRDERFGQLAHLFPDIPGSRQIIEMKVDMVQSSCGFAVPFMDFKEERMVLNDWAEKKGQDGIKEYWEERNQKSIDSFETNILKD